MRVKVLENFSPYYNYGLVALTKGEEVSGGLALYLLQTASPVEPADEDARAWRPPGTVGAPEPEEPGSGELDIDATAADVLAWVGDNPERAAEALELELAKDRPRSTLVKQLEKTAADGDDS
ncbi:hypothetical protein AB0K71_05740 [Streptomyces syringium]|uniref:hypothetical protein n=1 Tax=Streptomyces syringium TaxID=76729 RepID=UPI00343E879A